MREKVRRSMSLLLVLALCFSLVLTGIPSAAAADDYWWLPYVENPEESFPAPGVDLETGQVTSEGGYILLTSDVHRYAYLLKDLLAEANAVVHEDSGTDANVGFLAMGGDYANEQDIYADNMTIMKHAVEDNSPGTVVAYSKGNHEGNVNNEGFRNFTGMERVGETAVNADGLYYYYNWGAETSKQTFLTEDIEKLDEWLAAHNDGKPVFMVSHFPIHYYNERRTTKNADKLMDVLNKYPQVVFCWGHNHTENDPAYGTIRLPGDVIQCGADPETTTKELNFTYVNLGALRDGVNECNGLVAKVNPDHSVTYWYLGLGLEIDPSGATWTDAQGNVNPIRNVTEPRVVSKTVVPAITPDSINTIERASIRIERPRVDNTPAENASVYSDRYVSGNITWTAEGKPVEGNFDFNTAYTATLDLKANEGFQFAPSVKSLVNFDYIGPMGEDYPTSAAKILAQDDKSITLEYEFAKTVEELATPINQATEIQEGHQYVLAAVDDKYAAEYQFVYTEEPPTHPDYAVSPVDVAIRDNKLVSGVPVYACFTAAKDANGYLLYSDASLKNAYGATAVNYLGLTIRGGGEMQLEAAEEPGLAIYNNWNIDEEGNPYLNVDGAICYPTFEKGSFACTTDKAACNVKLFDAGEPTENPNYVVSVNIPAPVAGEKPAEGVIWSPADETFAPGTAYTATVEVELDRPTTGVTIGRINGNNAKLEVSGEGSTATLTYTFGATATEPVSGEGITVKKADAIESGKSYVIVADGKAMTDILAEGLYLAAADVEETEDGLTGITGNMVFKLEGNDEDGYSIQGHDGYLMGKAIGDSPDTWGFVKAEEPAMKVTYADGVLTMKSAGASGGKGPGGPGGPPPGGASNTFYLNDGHFHYSVLQAADITLYEVETPAAFTDIDGHWAKDAIEFVADKGLFNGTGNGKFSPNDSMTRDMIVTVLWRLDGEPKADEPATFTDIAADQWYSDAVAWGQANDIVNGIGHNLFAPGQEVTREQIAALLYRYAAYSGRDTSAGEDTNLLSYTDAEDISDWAKEAMQWAVDAGIITGTDKGALNPSDNATRAEVATMLQRFLAAGEE